MPLTISAQCGARSELTAPPRPLRTSHGKRSQNNSRSLKQCASQTTGEACPVTVIAAERAGHEAKFGSRDGLGFCRFLAFGSCTCSSTSGLPGMSRGAVPD